ncbi:hypothetical protein [Candidatus Methylomicrobium oryzae]|jgi:16S rRNA C1402 N4-methylase RsmH|uniref:hypothetical protein n=1 Tax=Candidatus Methylomicrobium oryzae TaxID=2802053 RepID=UPI001923A838|nr:hypothetical protein [Methylomicrobium sp. RS1]MBL1264109.1 hypothetical protein [Methylomicrobium sp. RS1]
MEADKIKQSLAKIRNQALQQFQDIRAEIVGINEELHWLDHALAAIDRFVKTQAGNSSRVK